MIANEERKWQLLAGDLAQALGKSTEELKRNDGTYRSLTDDIDEYIKN